MTPDQQMRRAALCAGLLLAACTDSGRCVAEEHDYREALLHDPDSVAEVAALLQSTGPIWNVQREHWRLCGPAEERTAVPTAEWREVARALELEPGADRFRCGMPLETGVHWFPVVGRAAWITYPMSPEDVCGGTGKIWTRVAWVFASGEQVSADLPSRRSNWAPLDGVGDSSATRP